MSFIAVRDFGPIAHADVDLKPLTILIGSNNTGKSYLALAIYSVSRAIAGVHPYGYGSLRPRGWFGPLGARESSARSFRRAVGDLKNIAPDLEKLLGGDSEFREVPAKIASDLQYQNDAGEFDLHQVSSMMSEIAPFVLFLKYLVGPGHLFTFEEPESHLDPANQRHLARSIAMLVNAGVRVLVTTHSDIFLNQINNLMQASHLGARKRLRMGYRATEVLRPDEVSAYVFQPHHGGTNC